MGDTALADLLTLENAINVIMLCFIILCFLQAVLGFDNPLYISIKSKRALVPQLTALRTWGIIIVVALRVVLLISMSQLIDALAEPFFVMNWTGVLEGGVNFATTLFVFGGAIILSRLAVLLIAGGVIRFLGKEPHVRGSVPACPVDLWCRPAGRGRTRNGPCNA